MAVLSLKVIDRYGSTICVSSGENFVDLVCMRRYEEGDVIELTVSEKNVYLNWQVDDALGSAFVYVTDNVVYQIPFGEKRISYSPKVFSGDRHYLYAETASREEIECYRNLALNPADQHRDVPCFPHASANVETREEEDYYLEEIRPDLTVLLGVPDILDVELWVNERGQHTKAQMPELIKAYPDDIRAEYDILGNLSSFYVKWQETDQLTEAPSKRCYMLDRMNSLLIFGDGVRTGLPAVQDDVAFKVRIRCCNGERGNVGPGRIRETLGNLMFVDRITNPVKAYGGSSIESMEKALTRGANILKSRKRLISADDYVQEILNFSDVIDKVRLVAGRKIDGSVHDNALTVCLLLKDFEAGSYSFHSVAGMLKKHLLRSKLCG